MSVDCSSLGSHWDQQNSQACVLGEKQHYFTLKHTKTCFTAHFCFPSSNFQGSFHCDLLKWVFWIYKLPWIFWTMFSLNLVKPHFWQSSGKKSGEETGWKGGISLLWFHRIWLCDLQSLKKKIRLIHKQPGTKILLVSFYCTSGNQPIMFRTLGDWKGFCFFKSWFRNHCKCSGLFIWYFCLIFVTQSWKNRSSFRKKGANRWPRFRSNTKNKHKGLNSHTSPLGHFQNRTWMVRGRKETKDSALLQGLFNLRWLKYALCFNWKDDNVEILNKACVTLK